MFIKVTSSTNTPIFIETSEIVAVTISEFPKCKTSIWISDSTDSCFNCIELIYEVMSLINPKTNKENDNGKSN